MCQPSTLVPDHLTGWEKDLMRVSWVIKDVQGPGLHDGELWGDMASVPLTWTTIWSILMMACVDTLSRWLPWLPPDLQRVVRHQTYRHLQTCDGLSGASWGSYSYFSTFFWFTSLNIWNSSRYFIFLALVLPYIIKVIYFFSCRRSWSHPPSYRWTR